jgi:hypothetical protein
MSEESTTPDLIELGRGSDIDEARAAAERLADAASALDAIELRE